jgi:type III pantothenate kinase
MSQSTPVVAVDVGNSAIKLGLFQADSPESQLLPEPLQVLHLPAPFAEECPAELEPFLRDPTARYVISSVNRQNRTRLVDWIAQACPQGLLEDVSHATLPLELAVDQPEGVGVDRLAAAVAAARLRATGQAVVVVDLGSAITVDVVDEQGVFRGGAILPGMRMAADALGDRAEQLPAIDLPEQSPDVVGKNTVAAMQAGVFWGTIGAVRELSRRAAASFSTTPLFVVSGGDAQRVVANLGDEFVCVPHLVLKGLSLAALQSGTDRK